MPDKVNTDSQPKIMPGTNAIFAALVFGAVALMALLMLTHRLQPMAMTVFAIILAFSGSWVPQMIQRLRNRLARR